MADALGASRRSIMKRSFWLAGIGLALTMGRPLAADQANRVTILYDAFGKDPAMKKDWGFSALIEYGGKRVLFDTGNDSQFFAQNVKAAAVDLKKLDFVVISHRHLDHTAGLRHLFSVNPDVKIYVPLEVLGGIFGTSAPASFYRRDATLPQHMRYFDDHPPERIVLGTAWVGARGAIDSCERLRELFDASRTRLLLVHADLTSGLKIPVSVVRFCPWAPTTTRNRSGLLAIESLQY